MSFFLGMVSGAGRRATELRDQETQERAQQERLQQQQDFQREMQQARQDFQMNLRDVDQAAARRKEEKTQQSQLNILYRQARDFIDPAGVSVLMDTVADLPFAEGQAYLQDNLTRAQEWYKQTGTVFPASGFAGTGTELTAAYDATESATDAGAMVSAGVRARDLETAQTGVMRTETGAPTTEPRPQRTQPVEAADPITEIETNVQTGMLNGTIPLYPSIPLPPPQIAGMSLQEQGMFITDIQRQMGTAFDRDQNRIKQLTAQVNAASSDIPASFRQEARRVLETYDNEYARIAGSSADRESMAQILYTGAYVDRVIEMNPTFERSTFMQFPSTQEARDLYNMNRNLQAAVELQKRGMAYELGTVEQIANAIVSDFGPIAIPIDLRLEMIGLPPLPQVAVPTVEAPVVTTPTPTTTTPEPETVDEVIEDVEESYRRGPFERLYQSRTPGTERTRRTN